MLLRIEDHDRGRSRTGYERAALEDLDWLGLVPDQACRRSFERGASPYRQSDCAEIYAAALERLRRARAGVRLRLLPARHRARSAATSSIRRPATPVAAGIAGSRRRTVVGIRMVLTEGTETFTDLRLGEMAQAPARQCGDLLLRDRAGNWTYQFAVVVDDLRHEVDLVIRGEDLLPSTGRQILLGGMLGRERPPVFLHHPLIRKDNGAKLSKSSGDTGVRELRAAGATPEAVLGQAAWRTGLLARSEPLPAAELASLFAGRLSRPLSVRAGRPWCRGKCRSGSLPPCRSPAGPRPAWTRPAPPTLPGRAG